jgi:hypothetical protein
LHDGYSLLLGAYTIYPPFLFLFRNLYRLRATHVIVHRGNRRVARRLKPQTLAILWRYYAKRLRSSALLQVAWAGLKLGLAGGIILPVMVGVCFGECEGQLAVLSDHAQTSTS